MAKKIGSEDLFKSDLFTKTKDDALAYLVVLQDIEKEFKDILSVQGQLVKTNQGKDVSSLKKREAAVKNITAAERELLKVEKQIQVTEAKLEISNKDQVEQLAKLRAALNAKNKAQRDSIKRSNEESNAYKKLSANVNEAQANFKRLAAQFGVNSRQAKKAGIALDKVQKELRQIDVAAKDGRRNVGRYGESMSRLGSSMKGIGLRFVAVTGLIYGLGRAIGSSFRTIKDFQQGTANLASVLGKTRKEIKPLIDDAKRLGASTVFTASQVTELQVSFSKLGFKEDEILSATEATLALAAATGSDLSESATVAAQTLNGFGLGADETQRVVDVMAKSFSTSALDMQKFSASMANVAPVAKIAGFSIEKTTAILGTLVDSGLDASKAGTDLRNIFQSLAKEGITMEQAMDKIRNSTDKITTATDLFGKRSAAAGIIMADNNEHLIEMEAGLNNAGGAAQEMADTQLDTLSGATSRMSSAWEGFILSLESGDGVIGRVLRGAIDLATTLLDRLTEIGMTESQLAQKRVDETGAIGSDIANEKSKAIADFSRQSREELEEIVRLQEKNFQFAEKALRLKKQGLSQLEIEVALNSEVAMIAKKTVNEFDKLEKGRADIEGADFFSDEFRDETGFEARLLDIDERAEKEISVGLNVASKKAAQDRLRKASLQEINDIISNQVKLEKSLGKAGQATVFFAKQELQRRLDLEGVNSDITSEVVKQNKGHETTTEALTGLAKLQKDLRDNEKKRSDLLVKNNDENDKTFLKLTEQSAELEKQIKHYKDILAGKKENNDLFLAEGKKADSIKEDEEKKGTGLFTIIGDELNAANDAAKIAADKENEIFNERLNAAKEFYNRLSELSSEKIDKELENIDKEIEANQNRQTQLEAIANQGNLAAGESLKTAIRQQNELEKQKAELEERKQRRQAISSGLELLAANLEKGSTGNDAVSETFRQMTSLLSLLNSLPGFYTGTENAPEGMAWTDEKGAEIHLDKNGMIKDMGSDKGAQLKYLERGDKILTAGQSSIVKSQMNMMPSMHEKEFRLMEMQNGSRVVDAVQGVVQAVNDKPIQEIHYDSINQAVIDSMKGNRQLLKKHISNKPKF